MLFSILLGAGVLLSPQDSVRVEAVLSAARVPVGGTVVLAITVETGGATPADIPVPTLPAGLDLGPVSDFSQLQLAFPGGRRRTTRREIVLLARSAGEYRIPGVEITVAGRRYRTQEQILAVVGAAAGQPAAGPVGEVRLRAWAQPETVYAGEQILYQAEAVFSEDLRLRQTRAPVFQPPAVTGFWVYDLPDPVAVTLRVIGGGVAEVQTFQQVLFPLSAGSYVIPAARMQYEQRQGLVFTPETREAASQPVAVHARPLPAGAPAAFHGAVGSYSMSAELDHAAVAAGEPAVLRVTVQGSGNIKGVSRPELPPVNEADVYSGDERVQVGFANGRVSGRKVFEWSIVPRDAGLLTILPVTFSWFDPQAGAYRSATLDTLHLRVGTRRRRPAADTALAPLRLDPSPAKLEWTRSRAFLALQLIPPFVIAAWLAGRRRRTRRNARLAERSELRLARELRGEPRACLEHLALWLARQPGPAAQSLRQQVRQARYAPEAPTRAFCEEMLRRALELDPHQTGRLHTHALGTILLLAVGVGGQPAASTPFERGVAAYQRGNYEAAAAEFGVHLDSRPLDAAGWYDLGNAWARAGERGLAAAAWLHALALRPRDASARNNLRAMGATAALQEFAPRVPLSSDELRLLCALAWWGCWAGALLAWRRRRGALFAVGTALLVLAVGAGILCARQRHPGRALTAGRLQLRDAPALQAATLGDLGEAEPLLLLERRGGWWRIRSRDLREGWIENTAIAPL